MADSALSNDPLERYGAIERAYCEERWMAVIHDGQHLLSELAGAIAVPPEGLKERLQLLIAHAYLYGVGDRDSAEDLYQAVLRSGAEASLRQIAEQGLQQCALPVAPPQSQEQLLEPEQQQSPSGLASPAAADASDWPPLAAGGIPADVASPTESGSHLTLQERSAAQQAPQDSWGAATPQTPSGQAGALGWLTAEGTTAPQDSQALPVMPWLETGAAAASAPGPPSQPQTAMDAEQAASGPGPSPQAQPWTPLTAVPESALSPETVASLQATAAAVAAAFQSERTAPQAEPTADIARPDAVPQRLVGASDSLQPATASSDVTLSPPASPVVETLVADVVEEPELIELHLADALRREEVLLEPPAAVEAPLPATPAFQAELNSAAPVPADLDPPAGMDRRRTEPLLDDPDDNPVEQAPDLAPAEVASPVSDSPRPRFAAGMGPFSGPPEPVAEEDPEMLMGLLKVEMG